MTHFSYFFDLFSSEKFQEKYQDLVVLRSPTVYQIFRMNFFIKDKIHPRKERKS